jgi:hypothetical protein
LERRRPRHPHLQASESRIREAAVIRQSGGKNRNFCYQAFTQPCAVCSPFSYYAQKKTLLRPDGSDPIGQRGVQGRVLAITLEELARSAERTLSPRALPRLNHWNQADGLTRNRTQSRAHASPRLPAARPRSRPPQR